jgi:calcineurin-like phosphoesterase family protein
VALLNYYISDLHFGCQNKFENRTLEHDKLIKENWNAKVHNDDTTYVLGDIGRTGNNKDNEYICEIISTLKGRKVLIQGNHDQLKDSRLKRLFSEICTYKEIQDSCNGVNRNLVLCHYPILCWNNQHKGWIHLYGHVHDSTGEEAVYRKSLEYLNEYFTDRTMKGYTDSPQARAYNVGCMLPYMDYTPRTLQEIMIGGGQTESTIYEKSF